MIYFIQSGKTGPIKIGYTKDEQSLNKRIQNLQIGASYPLRVLGVVTGNINGERRLHKKFHVYQTVGEWFQPSETLLNYIFNVCGIDRNKTHKIHITSNLKDLENRTLKQVMDEIEINYIKTALKHTTNNKTKAAKILKISFDSLRYKLEKFNIT